MIWTKPPEIGADSRLLVKATSHMRRGLSAHAGAAVGTLQKTANGIGEARGIGGRDKQTEGSEAIR